MVSSPRQPQQLSRIRQSGRPHAHPHLRANVASHTRNCGYAGYYAARRNGDNSDHYKLSEQERDERISSGQSTYVRNRVGWAMTFLTKAVLISKGD